MIVVLEGLMAKREKMTVDERYKLIRNVKTRYLKADRSDRAREKVSDRIAKRVWPPPEKEKA